MNFEAIQSFTEITVYPPSAEAYNQPAFPEHARSTLFTEDTDLTDFEPIAKGCVCAVCGRLNVLPCGTHKIEFDVDVFDSILSLYFQKAPNLDVEPRIKRRGASQM